LKRGEKKTKTNRVRFYLTGEKKAQGVLVQKKNWVKTTGGKQKNGHTKCRRFHPLPRRKKRKEPMTNSKDKSMNRFRGRERPETIFPGKKKKKIANKIKGTKTED